VKEIPDRENDDKEDYYQ
jgi:hypothetical protein